VIDSVHETPNPDRTRAVISPAPHPAQLADAARHDRVVRKRGHDRFEPLSRRAGARPGSVTGERRSARLGGPGRWHLQVQLP
jgi:hypothetical protein